MVKSPAMTPPLLGTHRLPRDRNAAVVLAFYEHAAARAFDQIAKVNARLDAAADSRAHAVRTAAVASCFRAALNAARAQGASDSDAEAAARAALGPTDTSRSAAMVRATGARCFAPAVSDGACRGR